MAQFFYRVLDIGILCQKLQKMDAGFLKYYLVDYLWAFSLGCGLHWIFKPFFWGALVCSGTVALLGCLWEGLQYWNIVPGTADVADCFLYVLAGITVSIINYFLRGKENEKSS